MTTDEEIVTMLRDLNAKVDSLQKNQATMIPDIIEHILNIFKQRWKEEQAKRRERTW